MALSITATAPFLFTLPSIPEAEKSWAGRLNAIPVASSSTFLPTSWPLSPSDARSTSSLIISRPIKPSSSMTFWPIIPKSAFILRPPILLGLTKSKSGLPKSKGRSLPEASSPPSTISEEKSFVTSGITTKLLLPSSGLTLRLPNESMRSSFICYAALGRFHAQWRREQPKAMSDHGLLNEVYEFGGLNIDGKENYTILEAEGHGHYVGCLFSVYNLRRSPLWDWYGEGDDMIFVDGEPGFAAPDSRRESNVPGEPTGANIAP